MYKKFQYVFYCGVALLINNSMSLGISKYFVCLWFVRDKALTQFWFLEFCA